METKPYQFLIITFVIYLGKMPISNPPAWVSWIPCEYLYLSKSECFLKIYFYFQITLGISTFMLPYFVSSVHLDCPFEEFIMVLCFQLVTLIWYSDTNNYLFCHLIFPFDMSQLWSFQRKRHFKLNVIRWNSVGLWNKETVC